MSMEFGNLAGAIAGDGRISAEEILELRRQGWADGKMDPEEAEALFAANDACVSPTSEWCDFFVEALSSFIVQTVEPKGYVDDEMADELIARIDRDGRVGTMAELELLVRVSEIAINAPGRLKAYALKHIEDAVLHGEGPTRHGELSPKGINETECRLLRRLIFAPASDRPAAVSKSEAEMLFRIKDASLYEANAAEWEKLFVQGVANYLQGFGGKEPLRDERAAELEAFMNREGAGVGGFLGRMFTSRPDFDGAFGSLLDLSPHAPDVEDDVAEAAEVTAEESHWLTDLLEADEELDPLEKALLAFIAEDGGEVFGL
ncbi:MAG: hypothetical protein C0515_11210 [Novosphingobium sp.]|nr:hypothetical protein [Novosphingobium sp.]